jgi:hypothetical protein
MDLKKILSTIKYNYNRFSRCRLVSCLAYKQTDGVTLMVTRQDCKRLKLDHLGYRNSRENGRSTAHS